MEGLLHRIANGLRRRRTGYQVANAATRHELVNTATPGEDGWAQIAPFGDYRGQAFLVNERGEASAPTPCIQRLDKAAAEAMVAKYRSPISAALRWARGLPIFAGHPDQPGVSQRYADRTPKGVLADLEVRADGLYARPIFNSEGERLLARQPGLAFSARWNADEIGIEQGIAILRPSELLSAGLTRNPNLPVQAINESMDLTELIKALRGLGIEIADGADMTAVCAACNQAATAKSTAQTQAANERDTARTDLSAARTELANERNVVAGLRSQVANERTARAGLLIDAAIRENRITEADRSGYVVQFANDFAAAETKLAGTKPGDQLKTSARANVGSATQATATIAQRQRVVQQMVNERITKGETYDVAFAAVLEQRPDLFGASAAK